MVIFTTRQNLANLNEVKINLIVKFANLAGKSYNPWFHDEKKDRDKTMCIKCPEWIRICCHGNSLMTEVCRIMDLHIYIYI